MKKPPPRASTRLGPRACRSTTDRARAATLRLVGVLILALGAGGGAACQTAPPPKLGGPTPLLVPQDSNPSVIWVVRPIEVEKDGNFRRDRLALFGLFACYRSPEPGPPECFLARTAGDGASLVWPDNPEDYVLPQATGTK